MRDDDTTERGDADPGESRANGRASGFTLDVGLGSLSGLLGTLLDPDARTACRTPMTPGHRRTPGYRRRSRQNSGATSSPERPWRGRRGRSDGSLFDTRFEADEFVVTADIPDATRNELSVGIRARTNTLVIGREDSVIRRIDIPWLSPEATRVWFHNGVLEVRLQPVEH